MELGLTLGNKPFTTNNNNNVEINNNNNNNNNNINNSNSNHSMEFCMGLGVSKSVSNSSSSEKLGEDHDNQPEKVGSTTASPPRLQLDLLPLTPLPRHSHPPPSLRFPWLSHNNVSPDPDSSDGPGSRTVEANRAEAEEQSSPNSGTSSIMELSLYTNTNSNNNNSDSNRNNKISERHGENGNSNNNNYGQEMMMMMMGGGVTTSRGSDDEENGSTRKKLRLSKEQSAFLEDNFKERHTLNPKQKLALAKQLNLRPRQVEVWFQNRRARTKLKQTEVDCEYLKRCCETLTEENRRLQKELQDLRALKTSQPFFMHLPATTLTMCPSCERVTPSSAPATATPTRAAVSSPSAAAPVGSGAVTVSLGNKLRPDKLPIQTQIRVQTQINTSS